jgi:hypothetical protein
MLNTDYEDSTCYPMKKDTVNDFMVLERYLRIHEINSMNFFYKEIANYVQTGTLTQYLIIDNNNVSKTY